MGVHDNADSKYSMMAGTAKLGAKRPPTTVVFHGNSKQMKREEQQQQQRNNEIGPDNKSFAAIQMQRKTLPVYRLRKK